MTTSDQAAAAALPAWGGDPSVTWQVMTGATFATDAARPDVAVLQQRLERVAERHRWPWTPEIEEHPDADEAALFARALERGEDSPLALLIGRDEWVMCGHHRFIDGFGFLALLGVLLDEPLASAARGVGDREPPSRRRRWATTLLDALSALRPGAPAHTPTPTIVRRDLPTPVGAAGLAVATARALPHRRPTVTLGSSLRPGSPLGLDQVDDQSTWLRLRARDVRSVDAARAALRSVPPQRAGRAARGVRQAADAPERTSHQTAHPGGRRAGIVGRLVRLGLRPLVRLGRWLQPRMGTTVLVSHVGTISAPRLIVSLTLHPTTGGREAIAVGAIAVATDAGPRTTIVVRSSRRRPDGWVDALADRIVAEVARLEG